MKNFIKHLFIALFLSAVFFILWRTFSLLSLIIFPSLLVLILIFITHKYDVSIPHVSVILRRQYFKTKFKIHYLESGKKNKIISLFFNKIYFDVLCFFALIFKSSKEGFELLREDAGDFKDDSLPIKTKVLVALENMEKRIRAGDDIGEGESADLYRELIALHRERQKRATIFSLFSLAVIIVSAVITSLILNFLIRK